MSPLVQVENLVKQFGKLRALDGLSLTVEAGEWIAVMGPSGSGKTTLINILGGLDSPTSGSVLMDGADLAGLGESELVRYRAEKVGFVFQQFHLVPYLTALENVMLAQYFHSITDEEQAAAALRRVGLAERLEHLPSQLSGGEQHSAGHTIVMVTHAPAIARLADRRIELAHGRLEQITAVSAEEEERFDHLLEQIWICGEEGTEARVERIRTLGSVDPVRTLGRMADLHLVEVRGSDVRLTEHGGGRARDVIRRHRLAERLFTDTCAIPDSEAHSQACKFEHIISPELDQKICTFLNHPMSCPHGNPIPPGDCCVKSTV